MMETNQTMIKSLFACGCLVLGGLVIKKLIFRYRIGSSWKYLPDDIMELIVLRLSVRDRIRLSAVCKSWRSVPLSLSIPISPHNRIPWLVLPQRESQALACNDGSLSFFDINDGRVVKIELPEPVRGGWFRGSCGRWLVMIKEDEQDSTIFLVNPISRAQHQLPSLRTIPSFQNFLETARWKKYGAYAFYCCLVLSTSDVTSEGCVVAASLGSNNDLLGLCRSRDKTWSVFQVLDADESISDLVFLSGKLYALVISDDKFGFIAPSRTLSFGDHSVDLKLVYHRAPDFNLNIEYYGSFQISLRSSEFPFLVESENQLLLVEQIQDVYSKRRSINNNREEQEMVDVEGDYGGGLADAGANNLLEEEDQNTYKRTSCFDVFKYDLQNNSFVEVESMGDNLLFLSPVGGALNLRASDVENKALGEDRIYFATNSYDLCSSETKFSRDIGVFDMTERRIRRPFPSVEVSPRTQLGWFIPSL